MSRHTSWHAGGPAELYFSPRDRADLASFLRALPSGTAIHWIGLGSNLLVRDGGVRGVVIASQSAFDRLERRSESSIYCEAGVPCARIARQCVKWGLGQAEFFAGIPGTLGGALAMNAGAFGGETWNHVINVETIDRSGNEHRRDAGEFRAHYRRIEGLSGEEWFVSAQLRFERKPGVTDAAVRSLLEQRKATQPIGEWSCGSVFTNPPGDHAARLIEAAGLKGYRLGDASVSHKHANFIINHGHATAGELEQLIEHVRNTVESIHGVRLHPEVRVIGEQG
jgi:UDP-N-acetylmuramate dehydrogenase